MELSVFDVPAPQPGRPAAPESPTAEGAALRSARVAVEADFEYWSQFDGDYGAALDYLALLFAAIGDMFQRDVDVKLALTYIRIWTHAGDPYSYVGGDIDGLDEFRDYWKANHSSPGQPGFVERDVAHLLSSRSVGAWAWTGVLCNYDGGYSISYVDWRNKSGYEDGTVARHFYTVQEGADYVQPAGTVRIASGSYAERITIVQPMTLEAPSGVVTIGE